MPDPTTATLSNGAEVPESVVHAVCHRLRTMQGQTPADCWQCTRREMMDGEHVTRMCFALAEDTALAALAQAAPADRCTKDGEPCCVGDENDTHFRCGTVQCGMFARRPAAPTVTAERLRALAREFKMRSETAKKMANTTRYTFDRIAYENIEKTFVECAAALEALAQENTDG